MKRIIFQRCWLLLCCACFAGLQAGQPLRAPEFRFLLLVDVSFSVHAEKAQVVATTRDLIKSGFEGVAAPGDGFSVWAYQKEVFTKDYPVLHWDPVLADAISRNAAAFLNGLSFANQSDLTLVLHDAARVAATVPELIVVLITDGDDLVRGTAFDDGVNAQIKLRRKELQKKRLPLVISFHYLKGSLESWAVGQAGTAWRVPPTVVRPAPAAVVVLKPVPAETKPTAKVEPEQVPEPIKPVPVPVAPPAPVVKPVVLTPQPTPVHVKTNEAPAVAVQATNPIPVVAAEIPKQVPQSIPRAPDPKPIEPPVEKVVAPPKPEPVVQSPAVAVVQPPLEKVSAKPVVVAPVPVISNQPKSVAVAEKYILDGAKTNSTHQFKVAAAAAAEGKEETASRKTSLFIGLGLLTIAVLGARMIFARPARGGAGSIISQSMERKP